jgi:hypothetical protein
MHIYQCGSIEAGARRRCVVFSDSHDSPRIRRARNASNKAEMPTSKESLSASRKGRKVPAGDRRQFLATLDANSIKALKSAVLDDERSASDILEEAAREWLERRKVTRARKS